MGVGGCCVVGGVVLAYGVAWCGGVGVIVWALVGSLVGSLVVVVMAWALGVCVGVWWWLNLGGVGCTFIDSILHKLLIFCCCCEVVRGAKCQHLTNQKEPFFEGV